MHRTPVNSSNLHSVGYDPITQTLEVAFNTGGVYQYFGVPAQVYQALMYANSHGQFFAYNIKNVYRYRRIG